MTDNTISSAVIIGAGIFGVSTGVQLARRGIKVTILNDGPRPTVPPAARFPG